jgi:hypothetical protein
MKRINWTRLIQILQLIITILKLLRTNWPNSAASEV